jgi:hypothetical protein
MDAGKIGERVRTAAARAGERVKEFAGKLKGLGGRAGLLADRLLARVPREKRRPLLLCLGGAVSVLICLVVILLAGSGREGVREAAEPAVPPEELFFPGEPDFVPSLLLEREPRRFWTPEDLAPFWKDPGDLGRDRWMKEMEQVIDTIMEEAP